MNPDTQPIKCCVIGIVIRTRTRKWLSVILLTAAVHSSFRSRIRRVVCPLFIVGLERKIYFSRYRENVAQFVVLAKKIGIR